MKSVLVAGFLGLMTMTTTFAGHEGGGGFYGKANGKWVLLDDLEGTNDILPADEKYFAKVEKILKKVEETLPEFAKELRSSLTSKTWHVVPFELSCEAPGGHLKVEVSAGACQDETDVWIEETKFKTADKGNLILHELVQAVRLASNSEYQESQSSKEIKPSGVRAIYRVLTRNPFPSSGQLLEQCAKYNFKHYKNYADYHEAIKASETYEDRYTKLKSAAQRCQSAISEFRPTLMDAKRRAGKMTEDESLEFFNKAEKVLYISLEASAEMEVLLKKIWFDPIYPSRMLNLSSGRNKKESCDESIMRFSSEYINIY